MKKLLKILGMGLVGIVLIVSVAAGVIYFAASNFEQLPEALLSKEQASINVIELLTDIASFEEEKIGKVMSQNTSTNIGEFLAKKEQFGRFVKLGEPVMQKVFSSKEVTRYHFMVPSQFENKVGSYWVHLVHRNSESKIEDFSIK